MKLLVIPFIFFLVIYEFTHLSASFPKKWMMSTRAIRSTNSSKKYIAPNHSDAAVPAPNDDFMIMACAMFRIWDGDSFRMTNYHLKDWIEYMAWAGVNHFRLYNNEYTQNKSIQDELSRSSFSLSFDFLHWPSPYNYASSQRNAIADCMTHALLLQNPKKNVWVISCDIDEYPFSPSDPNPNFLRRIIDDATRGGNHAQILFRSLFFGDNRDAGMPIQPNTSVYKRFLHRHSEAEGEHHRTKPLFLAHKAYAPAFQWNIVHEMTMLDGVSTLVLEPWSQGRLNHYWGNRIDRSPNESVYDDSLPLHYEKSKK